MAQAGFRSYWRLKSRRRGGRPQIETELRALIRRMSIENPLWGAPRIHGELLKLGFEVAQSSVAKYMVKRRGPPSQGWRTFLRNHAQDIAAMDLFVVPTIGFKLLFEPQCGARSARISRRPSTPRSNRHGAHVSSASLSRAFFPWRLSDDGPGASRIVAMGRHPKPLTTTEIADSLDYLVGLPERRRRASLASPIA